MLPVTKTMISDAFLELSKVKSIDKITVKDIVETCNITRQTFYYHFQDIMDVIEWSFQQRMEEILEKSLQIATLQHAVRTLISLVEEHPKMINRLMSSQKREQTENLLFSTVRAYMKEWIDRNELFMDMKRSDIEIALSFFAYAVVGIMLEISLNRKTVDLDMISRQISQLISGEMFTQKQM